MNFHIILKTVEHKILAKTILNSFQANMTSKLIYNLNNTVVPDYGLIVHYSDSNKRFSNPSQSTYRDFIQNKRPVTLVELYNFLENENCKELKPLNPKKEVVIITTQKEAEILAKHLNTEITGNWFKGVSNYMESIKKDAEVLVYIRKSPYSNSGLGYDLEETVNRDGYSKITFEEFLKRKDVR